MPIDLLTLGAAFLGGLVGSVHCLVMCGGVAAGLAAASRPVGAGTLTGHQAFAAALALNLGRVLGYTLAGLLVGLSGTAIVQGLDARHLMFVLRLAVGAVLVLVGLRLVTGRDRLGAVGRIGRTVWPVLQRLGRALLPADTAGRRLALGALWGWLPCGLVYSTLLWAASQGNALDSALLMFAFGLGTWPVLLATGLAAERLTALLRKRGVRIAGGLLVILFGLWTLPGPHQAWLMGHGGHAQPASELHQH